MILLLASVMALSAGIQAANMTYLCTVQQSSTCALPCMPMKCNDNFRFVKAVDTYGKYKIDITIVPSYDNTTNDRNIKLLEWEFNDKPLSALLGRHAPQTVIVTQYAMFKNVTAILIIFDAKDDDFKGTFTLKAIYANDQWASVTMGPFNKAEAEKGTTVITTEGPTEASAAPRTFAPRPPPECDCEDHLFRWKMMMGALLVILCLVSASATFFGLTKEKKQLEKVREEVRQFEKDGSDGGEGGGEEGEDNGGDEEGGDDVEGEGGNKGAAASDGEKKKNLGGKDKNKKKAGVEGKDKKKKKNLAGEQEKETKSVDGEGKKKKKKVGATGTGPEKKNKDKSGEDKKKKEKKAQTSNTLSPVSAGASSRASSKSNKSTSSTKA